MSKPAGLRTEIIVSLTLLMAAALLFTGFLLLKLTERELVGQRLRSVTATMELVSRVLASDRQGDRSDGENLERRADPLLRPLAAATALASWSLVGRDLRPLGSSSPGGTVLQMSDLQRVKVTAEPSIELHYSSAWDPFHSTGDRSVAVTVPVMRHGEFAGALQARFSLAGVHQRVIKAQKVMFLYVALYGLVLVLFGGYLLGRTVVRPARRLMEMTQQVAAGDLEAALPLEGPREIAELSGSFNAMTRALKKSREETEAHIRSLQQANLKLQQTRDELIRSERLASVGHLAAGMAHEIGNPLGAAVGYLELLREELPTGNERDLAGRALAEAQRIDRLVRDLLDYASPHKEEADLFDPAIVLREARDMLAQQGAFAETPVREDLPEALPLVAMSRHKLQQVFVNLLVNARDAVAGGGTIQLRSSVKEEWVRLAVADEGTGMAAEAMAHIFDPFYTTKAPGKGRGLGLAVCQRVIDEAGGRIEVRSAKGAGSVFTVWLRRADAEGYET